MVPDVRPAGRAFARRRLVAIRPKKFLCIVDAQPPQGRARAAHDTSTLDAIKRKYPALEGEVSSRYYDDNRFFSKQMLYGRFGDDGEKLVEEALLPAFGAYVEAYVDVVERCGVSGGTRGPSRRTTTRSTPSATRRTGSSRRTSARRSARVPLGSFARCRTRARGTASSRKAFCVYVAATASGVSVHLSVRVSGPPVRVGAGCAGLPAKQSFARSCVAWTRGHRSPLRPASTPPGIQRLPRRSERAARCVP